MDRFDTVETFLLHHQHNRPQSFKEILACVDRSHQAIARKLKLMAQRGEVNVVLVNFKERQTRFYTLRRDVDVSVEYPGAVFRKTSKKEEAVKR